MDVAELEKTKTDNTASAGRDLEFSRVLKLGQQTTEEGRLSQKSVKSWLVGRQQGWKGNDHSLLFTAFYNRKAMGT